MAATGVSILHSIFAIFTESQKLLPAFGPSVKDFNKTTETQRHRGAENINKSANSVSLWFYDGDSPHLLLLRRNVVIGFW